MSETENTASGSNPVATTSPEDVGLCEHCVSGARLSGTLKGTFVNTTPLPTYVALAGTKTDHATPEVSNAEGAGAGTDSADVKATKITPGSTKALVIVPDIFGFSLPNPKLMADILAEKCGIDVWAFDIFSGWFILDLEYLSPHPFYSFISSISSSSFLIDFLTTHFYLLLSYISCI